jgi:zinc transport system ATP-binding protein
MTLPARSAYHPDLSTQGGVVLVARNLRLGYGRKIILDAVDLTIHEGERWALLGRNGAGKSTFLKTLVGEISPLAGTLALNRDLVLEDGLGLVPQRVDLDPHLPTTVREMVSLGLIASPLGWRARRQRLAEILEELKLTHLARRDLRRLSGGQRQRVLLARALVCHPALLVLDEPTVALDTAGEEEFVAAIEGLAQRRRLTVLLVTHDLVLAERFCTHAARFIDGRVHNETLAERKVTA